MAVFIDDSTVALFVLLGIMCVYVNMVDKAYRYRILCNSNMIFVAWGISQYFFVFVGLEELILVGITFVCGIIHHFYWGISMQLDGEIDKTIVNMAHFLNKQKDSKIKEED